MIALRPWLKQCKCGAVYGKFLADHRTVLVNDSSFASVLGVGNDSFAPITYFVQYRKFKPDEEIKDEYELIKRKWRETDWADGGIPKLMSYIGAENEAEIDANLERFKDDYDLSEELRMKIINAKEKL